MNGSAEYAILDNLKAKVNLGYDESNSDKNQSLSSLVNGFTNGTPGNGRGAYNEIKTKNRLLDLTLDYNKDFDNSRLEVLLGFSFQDFNRSGKIINGFGFSSSNLNRMATDFGKCLKYY